MLDWMKLQRLGSADEVATAAADRIAEAAVRATEDRGRFLLALAGGHTPQLTYHRLTTEPWRSRIPWRQTFLLWSDERCVAPHSPGSNYRMVREVMIDHVPVPADNVLRIRGERCALAEDELYERALHRLLGPDGRIDLMLLGTGADGHTASLFPGSPTLVERQHWVLPAIGPEPYPHRITMTLPLINTSRTVMVLVTGAEKAPIVDGVCNQRAAAAAWPINLVRPVDGTVIWLADAAACGELTAQS